MDETFTNSEGFHNRVLFCPSRDYKKRGGVRVGSVCHAPYLTAPGLAEVDAEGLVNMQAGGTPTARSWRRTFERVKEICLLLDYSPSPKGGQYLGCLKILNTVGSVMTMSVRGRRGFAG